MDPNRYVREIHEPLCDVINEICQWEEIDIEYVFWKRSDLREVLKRLSSRLYAKKSAVDDGLDGQRLARIRASIQWLNTVLNTYAHDAEAKPELIALSFAASLEVLRVNAGFQGLPAFITLDELREKLFASIFSEYMKPSDDYPRPSGHSQIEEQIIALHDKMDSFLAKLDNKKSNLREYQASTDVTVPTSVKQKLLDIRADIESVTETSKRPLDGWEHIIQYRRLDDLIQARPANKQELFSWVRTLNSFPKNQAVMKRQVERWGDEIIKALQGA